LVELEYTNVELAIVEDGNQIKPSQLVHDFESSLEVCRETFRLTPVALRVEIQEPNEQEYYRQFSACCRLAKAMKVVSITVPSAELGTPFNAEVERLQELVKIASVDGILVSIRTEGGRMSQDPDTAVVLCNHVKGLGITLDPSHYIFGAPPANNYDQLLKYVYHVLLRDTSKSQLQVRVGQGEVEYGRLIGQLARHSYNRALCVDIAPMPEVDHAGEMRKIRLLLESML
jgi:sugar phosphate isomerase/epimerase